MESLVFFGKGTIAIDVPAGIKCREVGRRLDGRIGVAANDSKGSTFFVELPATERPARREAEASAA